MKGFKEIVSEQLIITEHVFDSKEEAEAHKKKLSAHHTDHNFSVHQVKGGKNKGKHVIDHAYGGFGYARQATKAMNAGKRLDESLRSTSRYARRDHYHQIHGDKPKAATEKKEHHVYSHMDHAQLSRHIRSHMSDHVEHHEGKAKSSIDKNGHHTIHHDGGDEHLGASVKHMHDDAPASKPGHRVHIHSKDGHVHTLDHIKGTLQHYSKKKD